MDRSETDPTLAAVVVSYNVAPLLARCLESLRRAGEELLAQGDSLRVVVVDNASADGSVALVRERFPEVVLIESRANLGFGAGCNLGAGAAPGSPFVLFLNPDAEVTPGAVPALLERLRRTPAAAIAGPRLVSPDGAPQEARRRFPTLGALAPGEHPPGVAPPRLGRPAPLPLRGPGRRWRGRWTGSPGPASSSAARPSTR